MRICRWDFASAIWCRCQLCGLGVSRPGGPACTAMEWPIEYRYAWGSPMLVEEAPGKLFAFVPAGKRIYLTSIFGPVGWS
jgi:hypothetical protein